MTRALRRVFRHPLTLAFLLLTGLVGFGLAGWRQWEIGRLLNQAETALAERDEPKARELLNRYLAVRPGASKARLLAARAARRLGEYYEAMEHLRRCPRDRDLVEALDIETQLIDIQRGKEASLPQLRQRAEKDDELALVILEVLVQRDIDAYRLDRALQGLTLYLSRRPDDLPARLGRAFVWERFLYFADALVDYRHAVAAHPESDSARLKLAHTLLIVGTPDEAREHFQHLAERWPDRTEVRFGLAKCHRRLGQADEARRILDGLLAESPDHGEMLWERGQLVLEHQSAAMAEPFLHRAYRSSPHDRQINYSLYRCLFELGRTEEAESFHARFQKIDADLRRLDQVCKEVMKRPNDANLFCEGGVLFLRTGEPQEGVRWLQTALRLDPNCEAARTALQEAPPKRTAP